MEVKPYEGFWYPTMGGLPKLWAVYDIVDRNGYALSEKSIEDYYYTSNGTTVSGKAKNYLTDEEAAQYTVANIMAGDGSSSTTGVWNPLEVVEKTATPVLSHEDYNISWQADDYAICYAVTVNDKIAAFTTDTHYQAAEGDVVTVQSVNSHGALSDMSEPISLSTGITSVNAENNETQNNRIYNIMGQPVNKAQRGVYIINNKTVIVR